jgi:hypothetical protein
MCETIPQRATEYFIRLSAPFGFRGKTAAPSRSFQAHHLDAAPRLSIIQAQINRDQCAVGGNTSIEMKAVADLRSSHAGSQQVGAIDTDTTTPVIKVDFAEPGMRIPIHQVSRRE